MQRVLRAAVTIVCAVLATSATAGTPMPVKSVPLSELLVGTLFSVRAPVGSRVEMDKGRDSSTGRIVTPRFTLVFDYGLYADPLDADPADANYRASDAQIDGRGARIVSAFAPNRSVDRPYFSGVYFADLGKSGRGPLTLTLSANLMAADDVALAENIYRSIKFNAPVPN